MDVRERTASDGENSSLFATPVLTRRARVENGHGRSLVALSPSLLSLSLARASFLTGSSRELTMTLKTTSARPARFPNLAHRCCTYFGRRRAAAAAE